MKKKDVKLYNVIFPVWLLVVFPVSWLIVIPANFIIDSLVIFIGMKICRVQNIKESYKKSIIKVVLFGFAGDIIGGLFMVLSQFIPEAWFMKDARWVIDNFTNPVMYNPFESVLALAWVVAAMAISSVIIYFLNRRFSFKTIEDIKIRKSFL